MCGIAGILNFTKGSDVRRRIQRMKDSLRHRGPDGEGSWISDEVGVAFGHRRLAIIDLNDRSTQPMVSNDGRFVIVFNGEIYNYLELRQECEALGSRFNTESDTEVILECYRHFQAAAFSRFVGMWSLALYDSAQRIVVFSRDPFGIKPLYYGVLDGQLVFASEIKAFFAVDSRFEEPDEITVRLFEEGGHVDRGDWTFFRRIKRFPHAHYYEYKLGTEPDGSRFVRYWAPPQTPLKIGLNEAAEELRRLLKNSIRLHLRSDVPVGACLSGGLDSSAIVVFGSQLLEPGTSMNTFTARYLEHPELNEGGWAEEVARAAGANAVFIEPTYDFFSSRFDRMLDTHDEPFNSTSVFAQYAVFHRVGRSDVRVVLDGQGADEQLGGYHAFLPLFLKALLLQGKAVRYLREWRALRRNHPTAPLPDKHTAYTEVKRCIMRKFERSGLTAEAPYAPELDSSSLDELQCRMALVAWRERSFEETLLSLTCEANLPQLLRYEDRNSMAHSIESRVPFLEPNLVEFILSIPADVKIRNGMTKVVLREALRGDVPDRVVDRVDKLGFPTPEVDWLKRKFGLDVGVAGSLEWRTLIVDKWRKRVLGRSEVGLQAV